MIDPGSNKLFGVTGLRVFFEATLANKTDATMRFRFDR